MSTNQLAIYEEMKRFVNFNEEDAANLKLLRPVFEKHGQSLTDGFYDTLARFPETAGIIEGRVEALKKTHGTWMLELFGGEYGEAYFNSRMKIGTIHVKVGISPYFVEGVMDVIRTGGMAAIFAELDKDTALKGAQSLLKVLDLDLMIINVAYSEERLGRLTAFTGFSRKLIENCIQRAAKK